MNTRFLVIAAFVFFSFAPAVFARGATGSGTQTTGVPTTQTVVTGTPTGSSVTLINPLNSGNCTPNGACLMNFLQSILNFIIRIGAIVVVFMLVFVGYKFVAARGDPGGIEEARRMLLYTVIGALILLGAQAISLGIQATVQALSAGQ